MAVTVAKHKDGYEIKIVVEKKGLPKDHTRGSVLQNGFQQLRKETSQQSQAENADTEIEDAKKRKAGLKALPK